MTTMHHEGYVATIELDEEAGLFHGEVINAARYGLTFQGRTVDELRTAFAGTIADYVAWRNERIIEDAAKAKDNIKMDDEQQKIYGGFSDPTRQELSGIGLNKALRCFTWVA